MISDLEELCMCADRKQWKNFVRNMKLLSTTYSTCKEKEEEGEKEKEEEGEKGEKEEEGHPLCHPMLFVSLLFQRTLEYYQGTGPKWEPGNRTLD